MMLRRNWHNLQLQSNICVCLHSSRPRCTAWVDTSLHQRTALLTIVAAAIESSVIAAAVRLVLSSVSSSSSYSKATLAGGSDCSSAGHIAAPAGMNAIFCFVLSCSSVDTTCSAWRNRWHQRQYYA
eukprot:2513-Heterococcus_DN1.PRE.1